ncbi:hypothetical protein BKA61DRAFT_577225 [Leptodontidium sp. MPI-SDFR-AT-0119]|nr:hypothetical protein BKA61DRAFT_581372 [Leptodontidium sp. MPI-SDFR-AT-0119]KAH6712123.1 hypothetical protein BKA61DRAFT_577225 [Leptodontidium sp. MPI-SDFR-AT-0119]
MTMEARVSLASTNPDISSFAKLSVPKVNIYFAVSACQDEGIINAVCEEERELTEKQAKARLEWEAIERTERPTNEDWKDVAFCDEFHLGIDPQVIKRVKRKIRPEHGLKPENVHRKKVTSKDTKVKAREDEHLRLLNVFVVIGYDYRKILTYDAGNVVGKMSTKCYTEQIHPHLLDDFRSKGLTLYRDADSAHLPKAMETWVKKNGLKVLPLRSVSPDFLIFESMANPLKRAFYARRRAEGQMTKY